MAITQDEIQNIINSVLSAIKTNSMTIDQLAPVTTLSDTDCFEINDGRKVTYSVLKNLITTLTETELDTLKNLINKCELTSVSFMTDDSCAELSISSKGETITCSVPFATKKIAGLMSPNDKRKLQETNDTAKVAFEKATSAQTTADKAMVAADKAQSDVDSIAGKIGVASGIAPLDANGFVPARFIPGAMNNVVEFARIIDSVATILIGRATEAGEVVYCASSGKFLWASASTPTQYYNDWAEAIAFGDLTDSGRAPVSGKVYIDVSTNKQYRWAGTTMAIVGTDLALGHTAQTAYPGDEGAALAVRVTSLGKELTQMSDALSESIDELDANISRANSDLSDYKNYLGIFPFDGTVVHAADVMKLAEGSVCFAITGGCFVKNAASGPSYGVPHNILNNVGGFESIRTDVVFRCGAKLYVSTSGSGISELESSTLRDYIISVRNGARNDLNDLEERMAMLRFDGMVQSVDDIRQEDTDSVWYVVDELCFYQPDEAGLSSSLPHNDSDRLMARDDVIFYCDGVLYRWDGELVEWNAEINARVDEIDAATRLNAANTGITAFDGIVSEADGVMHRPEGAIVYVEKLGYFVKRTPSGLSYGVPHNTFDPKYGVLTGVRSDIFFRCGSTLYRHNGTALVAVTGDIEVVKTALFNDLYKSAFTADINDAKVVLGQYDPDNAPDKSKPYRAYDDEWMSYDEALESVTNSPLAKSIGENFTSAIQANSAKVLPPFVLPCGHFSMSLNGFVRGNQFIEVVYFAQSHPSAGVSRFSDIIGAFQYCGRLRKILNLPLASGCATASAFQMCYSLEEVRLGFVANMSFSDSAKLSAASISYGITNGASGVTIIFHPDVYAKLTGDTTNAAAAALSEEELAQWQALGNAAAEKGIAIATV